MFLCLKKCRKSSKKLKKILGFSPCNAEIYLKALRHRSASITNKSGVYNNERLEFLGDAVLELIVSDYLFQKYPKIDEGILSRMRSNIVKRKSLNKTAVNIGIPEVIIYDKASVNHSKSIYGNALEAILGAIYIDKGYKKCYDFVVEKIIPNYNLSKLKSNSYDPKSRLYHIVQENKWEVSFNDYENLEENEPTHHFVSQVIINGEYISEGKGWTKKEAEQDASLKAINKIEDIS